MTDRLAELDAQIAAEEHSPSTTPVAFMPRSTKSDARESAAYALPPGELKYSVHSPPGDTASSFS